MEDKNNFNKDTVISVESKDGVDLSPENQETFDSLVKGVELIESGNKKAVDTAEIETEKVLSDIGAPPEAYLKISEINKTLKEALLGKPSKGSKMKKFFLGVGMTLLSQMPSFGANTEDVSDDVLVNENPIEMDISNPVTLNPDFDKEVFNYSGETEGLDGNENVIGDPKEYKMKFKTNFEMGSAKISQETIDAFKSEVADFIDTFSTEDLGKIKKGEMIIQIPVGSSGHVVKGVQETLGQTYTNNYELSQIRGEAMKNLVLEALVEKGISNPILMVDIPDIEGKEKGVSESGERFAGVKIMELTYENMAKNYDIIIVDPSGSMHNDQEEINKFKDLKAEIIDLDIRKEHRDTKELIYRSVYKAVHGAEDGSKIVFVTDEGDNSSFDFDKVKELREIAESKNIDVTGIMINPDNPNEKINFDYLNMMNAVKDKGGDSGDIKAFNLVKRILDIRRNK
ncbi:MAG: hypothetical protein LR005_01085 [Candidatus Pacebacteria bacterium]|nr:hypothetical protein [Candidatus Paceibacterota bacterium]